MDGTTVTAIIGIVTPFLFALAIIKMAMHSKEKKREFSEKKNRVTQQDAHDFEKEIRELSRKIENLEIILQAQKNHKDRKHGYGDI